MPVIAAEFRKPQAPTFTARYCAEQVELDDGDRQKLCAEDTPIIAFQADPDEAFDFGSLVNRITTALVDSADLVDQAPERTAYVVIKVCA